MIRNLEIALLSTLLALTACELLLRVFGDEFLPKPDPATNSARPS